MRTGSAGSNRRKEQVVPESERKENLAAPKSEVVATTNHGKEVEVKRSRCGQFWIAAFVGGGELPECLKGNFTSHHNVMQQVNLYKAIKGLE